MDRSEFDAFVNMVDDMMAAQKEYFAHRQPADLERAKNLERTVRARIKAIKAEREGRGQTKLFEE